MALESLFSFGMLICLDLFLEVLTSHVIQTILTLVSCVLALLQCHVPSFTRAQGMNFILILQTVT